MSAPRGSVEYGLCLAPPLLNIRLAWRAVAGAGPASAADKLPAYTRGGFCVTRTLNVGQPAIKGETCAGLYKVTRATYQFTEDNLHICPRMGIFVHLDEAWISPPTGGSPTILASYHTYL